MVQSDPLRAAKPVRFFCLKSGREPVRDWLRTLPKPDRKIIGRDVLTLQLGWPLGMPLARKLDDGLWEIRSRMKTVNSRIIFTVKNGTIVLLHGFIKKSRKTPAHDLKLARQRMKEL